MLSYYHMIKKSCDFFTCLGSSLSLGSQDASSLRFLAKLLLQSPASAFTLRFCLPLLFLFPVILVSVSLPFHFYFCLKGGERFFHFHLPQPLGKRIKASPFARSPFALLPPLTLFLPFCTFGNQRWKKMVLSYVEQSLRIRKFSSNGWLAKLNGPQVLILRQTSEFLLSPPLGFNSK